MIELISGFGQSDLGRTAFDQMPDSGDQRWRQQYYNSQLPMLTSHWPPAPNTQAMQMSGIQQLDVSTMFQQEEQYMPSYQPDMDMTTPSPGFANDMRESFSNAQPQIPNGLYPPSDRHRGSFSTYSPHSSQSGVSPREPHRSPQPTRAEDRPALASIGRAVTAPEPRDRRSTASSSGKQLGNSDEDEDYIPNETPSGRGRKRQRIPHTAVERRYRENLNAHLDKLRQTVPSLAARKGSGGTKAEGGEGAKPSKCEILSGAIEHIGAMDKDITSLKSENKALRARIEEMQNWYRANSR